MTAAPALPSGPDGAVTSLRSSHARSPGGLLIRVHGVTIGVSGTRDLLHETVWPFLACWQPAEWWDEATDVEIRLSLRGGGSRPCPYAVSAADGPDLTAPDAVSVACLLQAWIDTEVVRRVIGLAPVHAGVVAWGDTAILLPAPSGAGKTTLVAALLARGARYLSDEIALLDDRGWVHPYPRPLMVRELPQRQSPVSPAALGGTTETSPLPVGSMFFVEYRAHACVALEPRHGSEALLLLLRHTWVHLPDRVAPVGPFVRACDGVVAYQGVRGDASVAAQEILRLADATGDRR